jgi:dihydrofolate reductase
VSGIVEATSSKRVSDAVTNVISVTRTIFYTATTLNGFLADEHDSLEWLFAVPGGDGAGDRFTTFLDGIGALVQGSATYEWVLRHEDLLAHPEKWPDFYGGRPSWVFSTRSLPSVPGADVRFATGSVIDQWPAIRDSAGDRDVWIVGGGDLVGQFADAGLLDELRISVAPATLERGKPLLPRSLGADTLHLESVARNGQFAELVYTVASGR